MCDNQTIAEILKDALKLIANKNCWTTGVNARSRRCSKHLQPLGESVPSWSYDAIKWSLNGAIERAAIDAEEYRSLPFVHSTLNQELKGESIHNFNDRSSHRQVIALLKKAYLNVL